jgi:hypothetical protein
VAGAAEADVRRASWPEGVAVGEWCVRWEEGGPVLLRPAHDRGGRAGLARLRAGRPGTEFRLARVWRGLHRLLRRG